MSYFAEFLIGTLNPFMMWIIIFASLHESIATGYLFYTTGLSFLPEINSLLNNATKGFSDSNSSNSLITLLYYVDAFWWPALISL